MTVRRKLAAVLRKKRLYGALFVNGDATTQNAAFTYYSGFAGPGALLVKSTGAATLVTPEMEITRARKRFVGVIRPWKKEPLTKQLGIRKKSIGVEFASFSLSAGESLRKQCRIVDISKVVAEQRMIKTRDEIQAIKKACSVGDKALEHCIDHWKLFKTEADVSAFLLAETARQGRKISFDSIIASGKNAAVPHHEPTRKKIRKGFCVIDYGVVADNYCSDMTRTIYVGKPSKEEMRLYDDLLALQKRLVALAIPGRKMKELTAAYNEGIEALGFSSLHALGHGVGIEVHEAPHFSEKVVLEKNMVITIEPGVYAPGKRGIRIEDVIVVGKKPVQLTKFRKDLIQVGERY